MSRPSYSVCLEPEGPILQDRVRVIEVGEAVVIAVADGAGGAGASEHAAEAVIQGLEAFVEPGVSLDDEATWTAFLSKIDSVILRAGDWGETTAVVFAATDRWICGASVGDSEGWLATEADFRSFTSRQIRKPLLGSGAARPISFRQPHSGGSLIVGTDGLFKYAPAWRICQIAAGSPPSIACPTLIDLVRLPNGKLQDDVGFVVCRFSENRSETN